MLRLPAQTYAAALGADASHLANALQAFMRTLTRPQLGTVRNRQRWQARTGSCYASRDDVPDHP